MGWFVLGIILVLLGGVGIVARAKFRNPAYTDDARIVATIVAVAGIALGLFTIAWDSFTVVPARNVGVVTEFGKATTSLNNGFHWVAPWANVETIDATVQNINLDADTHNCITVRLANQTTACVDVTVQWGIDQHANANELWQRYRGTNDNVVANVGHNVVERELRRALNVVFEQYNPLSVLAGGGNPTTTDDLANRALEEIKAHVDPGIVIDTMRISLVHYDDTTQGKLNGYAQALADTQIATQQKLTATQQKMANDLLASGSSNDPGVMYQNCLNLLKDFAAKGQLQNTLLTCQMPGTSGSSPLVIKNK